MSYWEPDDAPELPDGWMCEEDVDELRDLLKHYEFPDPFPRPGNRNDAILVLLDHKLNPPTAGDLPEDPTVTWAKRLLKDVL